MSTDTHAHDVVVTGLGPVCPVACGHADLGVEDRPLRAVPDASEWFDAPRFLGPRGYKYLPPATRYMLAAAGLALEHAGVAGDAYAPEDRGVMVGSNFAVASVHAAMDQTILATGADALSPMEAANFSINLAASHVSLRHGCKGFNVCFTSAMVAGLEALIFGANAIRRGRAGLVVAGATEGVPPPAIAQVIGVPVEDGGACALTLERASAARRRGAAVYGTFSGGVLAFSPPARLRLNDAGGLVSVVTGAVDRLDLPPGPLHLYQLRSNYPFNDAVGQVVARVLGDRAIRVEPGAGPAADGSLITVSPLLQIAFALYRRQDCLIVTTSPRGHIAMVAFRGAESAEPRERRTPEHKRRKDELTWLENGA